MDWIVSRREAIAAGASKGFYVWPGFHFVYGLNKALKQICHNAWNVKTRGRSQMYLVPFWNKPAAIIRQNSGA
jgi:hypothetical protein